MKKKLPLPLFIGGIILFVALVGGVIWKLVAVGAAGDSGNTTQLAGEVIKSNPTNAKPLPAGIDPTKGAMMMCGKKR